MRRMQADGLRAPASPSTGPARGHSGVAGVGRSEVAGISLLLTDGQVAEVLAVKPDTVRR
jgi:hypothetical protein